MWQWLLGNAQALTVITTCITLLVWTGYGQLLSASARRKQTPRLLVEHGVGTTLDATCLLSNMSAESIYIRGVFVTLHTGEASYRGMIYDRQRPTLDTDGVDSPQRTCQGPLQGSDAVNLGTFRQLLGESAHTSGLARESDAHVDDLGLTGFAVTVVASFGPEEITVGARRRFAIEGGRDAHIRPLTALTEPLISRRQRKPLRGYLKALTEAGGG